MIVVGSGMAGLVATARGVELGLKVLVLEESVRTGGCIHYGQRTISGAGFKDSAGDWRGGHSRSLLCGY